MYVDCDTWLIFVLSWALQEASDVDIADGIRFDTPELMECES